MEKSKKQEDKLKVSLGNLDQMLVVQSSMENKSGLGFEIGECS